VARNPVTLAQTILRRILLTGGSGALSTTAPICFATTGVGTPFVTGAVGVDEALAAPSATRAAGGVVEGVSFFGEASSMLTELELRLSLLLIIRISLANG